jgi:NAD(P)-dependent dehydrogenase (short-subunit alcohol dehydrogenase family)
MQLAGSTAIVTGGASGLGATTAKLFSEGGARVALLDLNEEAARDVAASLDGFGTGCDVTDEASVVTALEAVAVRLGPARILVNCAGIAPAARIVGRKGPHSLADFRRVLDINLTGRRPPAAPSDVLVGVLDVAGLAVHAVLRVDDEAR